MAVLASRVGGLKVGSYRLWRFAVHVHSRNACCCHRLFAARVSRTTFSTVIISLLITLNFSAHLHYERLPTWKFQVDRSTMKIVHDVNERLYVSRGVAWRLADAMLDHSLVPQEEIINPTYPDVHAEQSGTLIFCRHQWRPGSFAIDCRGLVLHKDDSTCDASASSLFLRAMPLARDSAYSPVVVSSCFSRSFIPQITEAATPMILLSLILALILAIAALFASPCFPLLCPHIVMHMLRRRTRQQFKAWTPDSDRTD